MALTRAVVDAASGPVIAAGSVASLGQIADLEAAGAWGFTIGGAIFENRLPGGPSIAARWDHVAARPCRSAASSTMAHVWVPSTASAVMAWPARASTALAPSPASSHSPPPVPTRIFCSMIG